MLTPGRETTPTTLDVRTLRRPPATISAVRTLSRDLVGLQRLAGNRACAGLVEDVKLQRDPVGSATGIEVEPGPVPAGVLGARIPIPARLTKKPGAGQGSWLTAPSFALRMDPHAIVAGLLDTVTVGGFPLVNPTLVWDERKHEIVAVGQVRIPSAYPGFKDPTTIDVTVRSSSVGEFDVQGEMGPFSAHLTLDISYNTTALRSALRDLQAGDIGAAVRDASKTDRRTAFSASGGAAVAGVPVNAGRVAGTAGPDGVSVHGGAVGLVGLPAGTFRPDIGVPAVGAAGGVAEASRGGGAAGVFGFGGVTSAPDLGKLTKGDVGGGIAPFAYAQISAMRRTSDGHQFGITLSAQYQLGSAGAAGSGVDELRKGFDARSQLERHGPTSADDAQKDILDPAVLSNEADLKRGGAQGNGFNIKVSGTFDLGGG